MEDQRNGVQRERSLNPFLSYNDKRLSPTDRRSHRTIKHAWPNDKPRFPSTRPPIYPHLWAHGIIKTHD